jgi:CheY-like chemotaxis protein
MEGVMSGQKARMLIVEDEPVTRTLLSQIFERQGHPVSAAEDGFSALEEIRKATPDILLSDLNMPGMSGFELLSVVRRKAPEIYVIASSGAFSAGDGVPNGIAADAFHEKASGLNDLFELVKTAPRHEELVRDSTDESIPIWISPIVRDAVSGAEVLITCPECLRAFSLSVGAADFVIHRTGCVYCETSIHYATVQPMNTTLPHSYRSQLAGAASAGTQTIESAP